MKYLTVTAALMFLCAAALGAEYFVKTNGNDAATGADWSQAWRTISNAVAKTPAGHTIMVSNGLYRTTAEIKVEKDITLQSFSGKPEDVIVRGAGTHRIFFVSNATAVVQGFTVTNGYLTGGGSGVRIERGGTVRDCVIKGNRVQSGGHGGGVYLNYGGLMERCRIVENSCGDGRGGAGVLNEGGTLRNCVIQGNTGGYCGGIEMRGVCHVVNCTIVGNTASRYGAGVSFYTGAGGIVSNSIVMFNTAPLAPNYLRNVGGKMEYSCSWPKFPTGTGNIEADPEFMDQAAGDFRLLPGSPCLNSGRNQAWMAGATDMDGHARTNGVVDMGAYEYWPGALQCNMIADRREGLDSATVVFRAYVDGTNTSGLGYAWDFNGDGSHELTWSSRSVVTNTYASNGFYTVKASVANLIGETDTRTKPHYIKVGPSVAYMSKTGNHTFPYGSWDTAATNLQNAADIGVNGTLIRVKDDKYLFSKQLSISNGVTIRSEGGYTRAILDGGVSTLCLYMDHTNAVVDGFTITNGSAGRAVLFNGKGTVQNSLITKAGGANNGVYFSFGGTLLNSIIRGIYSSQGHGAAATMSGGGLMRNCLIAGNRQTNVRAAGVWMVYGGIIENCTFVRNAATNTNNAVGGILRDGTPIVRNSIFYYNAGKNGTNDVNIVAGGGVNWTYNCTSRAYGTFGVTNEPGFVNPGFGYGVGHGIGLTNGNFRLTEFSPCRDKGINQTWMTGTLDLDGYARRWRDQTVDMGAYEWRPPFGTVLLLQ